MRTLNSAGLISSGSFGSVLVRQGQDRRAAVPLRDAPQPLTRARAVRADDAALARRRGDIVERPVARVELAPVAAEVPVQQFGWLLPRLLKRRERTRRGEGAARVELRFVHSVSSPSVCGVFRLRLAGIIALIGSLVEYGVEEERCLAPEIEALRGRRYVPSQVSCAK